MADFTITGDKALDRKFRELPARVARKVIRQALRKAAKPIQARVKQLAPRGKTGALKRSVKVRAAKRTRKGTIRINVQIGAGDFKGDQFYAAMVERGTRRSGTGRPGQVRQTGQPAQRYMERAFEQTESQARRTALDEMGAGIEREASKG